MNAHLLEMINNKLQGTGVKCRDMTLLLSARMEYDLPTLYPNLVQHVCSNHNAAAIVVRTPPLEHFFLVHYGDNIEWVFYHKDNFYAAPALPSVERMVDGAVSLVVGFADDCPICLESFDVDADKGPVALQCGHHVHGHCLFRLIVVGKGKFACPVCRLAHETIFPVMPGNHA